MKNKMLILAAVAALASLTGCATSKTTVTQSVSKDGATNTVTQTQSKSDPLLTKVLIQKETFTGIDLSVMGGTSMSPAKFKLGRGQMTTITIPTATRKVYSAPLSNSDNDDLGWFQQKFGSSASTSPNLMPDAAFTIQTLDSNGNPLTLQVTPVAAGTTNAPAGVTNAAPAIIKRSVTTTP